MANGLDELEVLDPFAAAALRAQRAVRPSSGRKEGLGTLAVGKYLPRAAINLASLPKKQVQAIMELVPHMLTLPQRALGASQTALETGTYNPAPALEGALTAMGGTAFSAPKGAIGAGPGQFLPKKMDPEMLAAMERAGVKPAQPQGVIGAQERPQQWQQEALRKEIEARKPKGDVTRALEYLERTLERAKRRDNPPPAQPQIASPAVHTPKYSKEFVPEIETAGWQQIGPRGGVSPGGLYRDPSGVQWYLKSGPEGHIQSERVARELYGLTGAPVPQTYRAVREGEPAVASLIIPGKTMREHFGSRDPSPDVTAELGKHMTTDMWLYNTDLHGRNVLIPSAQGGKPTRIDFGSALARDPYGEPRPFTPKDVKADIEMIKEWQGEIYGKTDPATSARAALLNLPQEEVVKALNASSETSKLIKPALERRREILKMFLPDENINTILVGLASGAGGAAAALDPEMKAISEAITAYQKQKESK